MLCTNTMHRVADAIIAAMEIPFVHIADTTAYAVRTRRASRRSACWRPPTRWSRTSTPAACAISTASLSSSRTRLTGGFVHDVIYDELCQGVVNDRSRAEYRRIMRGLADRGAQGILLGCTEIDLLVGPVDSPVPVFDTTRLHAERAVDLALQPEPRQCLTKTRNAAATFCSPISPGSPHLPKRTATKKQPSSSPSSPTPSRRSSPRTAPPRSRRSATRSCFAFPEPANGVLLGLRIAHDILSGHGAPAVRVGMHHGTAIERDGDYIGGAVNLAARVSAAATGGEVLLTAQTAAMALDVDAVLYESRGRQTLRNVREPVELVAAIRQGHTTDDRLAVDPVCQMVVDPDHSAGRLVYDGMAYFFCTLTCAGAFARHPERFAN